MKHIYPASIPAPKGHYSPAVVHNGLVYVSGQLPIDPATGEAERGAIELQTELALRNVETILKAAGSGLGKILQITIYISEMDLWEQVNETYKRIMGSHKPARAIIPVKSMHFGAKIEIQAIAYAEEEDGRNGS